MGGLLSRNTVVPQQQLSIVASSAALEPLKPTKTKPQKHKFNTLVPEPLGPANTPQPAPKGTSSASPAAIGETLSRAELRVQFLKAVKRGDVVQMSTLLALYQQQGPQAGDSRGEDSEEGGGDELVNIRGMWDSTPLISATQYAHSEAALWLLGHDAVPHASNEKGVTALLLASLEGLTFVVEQLLRVKKTASDLPSVDSQIGVVYNSAADTNVRLSPLLAASMNGHEAIARLLLDYGAAANQQVCISGGSSGAGSSTALLLAARCGHAAVVTLLLQRGADWSLLDGTTDSSALVLACEHGHEDSALLLIEAMTVDVGGFSSETTKMTSWQAANRQGFTALHFAAANGLFRVCQTLLAALQVQQVSLEEEVMAMAFVNARAGARRETALLLAVRKRRHEVARLLLEAGADAELADRGGNTATQVLARNKQDALLQLCEINSSSKALRQSSRATDMTTAESSETGANPHKQEEVREAEAHARTEGGGVEGDSNGDAG
ncbi:hypothetical protein BBJ28_00012199 [Nothophytophthora sp. Chile5]|nr:hypothetical protein BBJ28_00012199 [Nothophytophthora sp. Chile5]